ncbi:MAG TPA: fused MFS/spermidine synthase, partial [Vicinamibacterales bacterium]|nr:fused MFS/spermidine synthase [Vicinamibacterales bacterium]
MRRLFLLIYGLSGAAGLIYEILWTRQLTLLMGHTTAAVSAVLAAFMGGLAIGAALGGRAAPQVSERRALQIYAGLELTVAASALLIPWALVLSRPLLAAAYADGAGTWFGVTRLVLSLAMLGVPTAAMGATLPFAARWYLRTMERAGAEAGDLYAGNTIGAATGAGLASFVLVPMLGVRTTLWIAASVNVVAAIVAWAISRRDVDVSGVGRPFRAGNEPRKSKRPADKKSHLTQQPAGTASLTLAAAALALTGFAALVSEVVWARVLALIIGPTTYAFGLMLTTFILGLAAGSFAGARLSARVRDARPSLALVVAAFGVASGAALWRMSGLPIEVAQSIATASGTPFRSVLWRQGIVAASLLLPVAIALGAAFPLAVGVAARTRERVARDLAILYASNTAAAIAGSLAAGFVLIPRSGLRPTIVGMVVLAGLGAGTLAVAGGIARSRVLVLAAVSVAAVALAWTAPRWDHALLSSGAYKYASYLRVPDLEAVLTAGSLEYYKEGAASTVTVRR